MGIVPMFTYLGIINNYALAIYICAEVSMLVSAVQSKSVLGSAAADQLDFRLGRAVKMSCKCNLQGFSCWQCQVTQSWPLSETQMKASLGRDGRDKVKSS